MAASLSVNCSLGQCGNHNESSNQQPVGQRPNYIVETLPILITKYTVLSLIVLFGVAGNIIVVIVTTKRKAFNTSLDLFVKNLAAADLGFLLFVVPIGVLRAELPFEWPMGEYFCLYVYPMLDIFYGSSVWIIAAIAIERYRNIVRMAHVHRRDNQTKRSAKLLMTLVWCFSFCIFCIPVYVSVIYIETPPTCNVQWTTDRRKEALAAKVYMGFQFILSYVLPLGIVIWTYIVISKQLSKSSTFLMGTKGIISRKAAKNRRQVETVKSADDHQANGGVNGNFHPKPSPIDCRRLTQNRRAKTILTPVAFVFALSMFPVNLLRLILIFWTQVYFQPYYPILFFITIIFACANSSINPLIYCIVSREFRNAFKSVFISNDRTHLRNSTCGFAPRESSKQRRTFDFSCSHLGNGGGEGTGERNGSRLFLACNTKL